MLPAPAPTGRRPWALATLAALLLFVFARLRGELPPYVDLHRWLAGLGVPDWLRNLDHTAWMLFAIGLAARLAHGRGEVLRGLGLRGGLPRGLTFGLAAGAPMLLQGLLGGDGLRFDANVARGVLLAPLIEELFFRAVLVGIPTRVGGAPFWPVAIAAAVLFGSVHVPWTGPWHGGHFGIFAATFCGGVWYAWIVRCFGGNLWTTIVLHALMNAAWMVTGVAGDAGGTLWPNLGRAATIVLGTVLAVRAQRTAGGQAAD
ncbi:MAG: CPBP family intramembrane metalloprotease [Planctomycetes bacterium]|nr:CPBP family intramembrane metalloprotease [Planctomycetota bacterium]